MGQALISLQRRGKLVPLVVYSLAIYWQSVYLLANQDQYTNTCPYYYPNFTTRIWSTSLYHMLYEEGIHNCLNYDCIPFA